MNTLAELQEWNDFRTFTKARLNRIPEQGAPIFISVDPVDFTHYTGNAVLLGNKCTALLRALKREGIRFKEGTCTLDGKELRVDGVPGTLIKQATLTFKKLALGFAVAKAEAAAEAETLDGDPQADKQRVAWTKLKKAEFPALREAIQAGAPEADKLKRLVAAAGVAEKQGDFETATKALQRAVEIQRAGPGTSEAAPAQADPDRAAFAKRKAELAPEIKRAVQSGGPSATDLRQVVQQMAAQEKSGQYAQGLATLERASTLLEGGEADATEELGTLVAWDQYRQYMKLELKKVGADAVPFFVSKQPRVFMEGDKEFKGIVVLAGPKAGLMVRRLKKEKVTFLEYTCRANGKELEVEGIQGARLKLANRTFKRLKLGYSATSTEAEPEGEGAEPGAGPTPAYKRQRKQVFGQLKEALAASAPNTAELRATAAEVLAQEAAADHAAAEASLGRLGEQLAAGATQTPDQAPSETGVPESGATESPTATGQDARAEFEALRKALLPGLREALADEAADPDLRARVEAMQAAFKGGDFASALTQLREIEAEIEGAEPEVELDSLENWDQYTAYMKAQLKKVKTKPTFFFVSRKPQTFDVGGSSWKGVAVIAGRKSDLLARKLKKDGVIFEEGSCTRAGKVLTVEGLPHELVRKASKTFLKLKLGFKCLAADDPGDEESEVPFDERYEALQPRLLEAVRLAPDRATNLQMRNGVARESADAGDLERAASVLDLLEPIVEEILAGGGAGATEGESSGSLVAYRQALLAFRERRSEISGGIAALQRAIPAGMPEEAELAEELAGQLQAMYDEIDDAVDAAINAADQPGQPVPPAVRSRLAAILADVSANPLISHVDSNPFVPLSIGSTLKSSLTDIRTKMPA